MQRGAQTDGPAGAEKDGGDDYAGEGAGPAAGGSQ